MRWRLAGALALLWLAGLAPGRAEPARACPGEAFGDVLRDVTPDGELVLGSGGRVVLADLRPAPGPDRDAEPPPEVAALMRSLLGSRIMVRPVGQEDRWARRAAEVAVAGSAEALDLAELLVGEGFALVDPGARDALCRPELLGVEQGARQAGRGYWRTVRVLRAGDHEGLKAAAGRFALVEGRIVSVGERRDRTYLNFGTDFSRDFSVVIPRRSWAAFKRQGRDAAVLKGRRVRLRGLMELGRAPSMEVNVPDVVELLADDARRNRTEPNL